MNIIDKPATIKYRTNNKPLPTRRRVGISIKVFHVIIQRHLATNSFNELLVLSPLDGVEAPWQYPFHYNITVY